LRARGGNYSVRATLALAKPPE